MEKLYARINNYLPNAITEHYEWLAQGFIAILVAAIISLIIYLVTSRLSRKKDGPRQSFSGVAFKSALSPVIIFIWVATLMFILKLVDKQFDVQIIKTILSIRPAIYGLFLCWFLLRLKSRFLNRFAHRHPSVNASTIDMMDKITSVIIIIGIILLILPSFGFSINGLLAFGGVGGIIVGLAAQSTLSNFFGAMQLHIERPFNIGDWISLPEKNIQGTVEQIGWRQVIIRNFDKRMMYIPTSLFSTMILENPSRMSHRRIFETIGIRYRDIDLVPAITKQIKEYLLNHPSVDTNLEPMANLESYGDFSVNLKVVAYTRLTDINDYSPFRHDILLGVYKVIRDNGGDIAFPTSMQYNLPLESEK